ncbi:biliverdin-producing heme oxygenase [Fulvimarina sp. MAC8]|uniref:biliverdin-producing heme oxygenase n=1 Tax=Fulvimarina sp. MAC8 TaxID=3162874 RepID=UPI0032EAFF66
MKFDRNITSDNDRDVAFDVGSEIFDAALAECRSSPITSADKPTTPAQSKRTDLRSVLRDQTERDHRDLDALVGDVWIDRESYAAYILMNHRAHHVVEPWIESALQRRDVTLPYQAMRHALDRDLEALEEKPLSASRSFFSDLSELTALAGALYVLEGSRLGARMLHRKVIASTWIDRLEPRPIAFFETARASGNFSQRMGILDTLMKDGDDLESAVQVAKSVFALFRETAEQARAR